MIIKKIFPQILNPVYNPIITVVDSTNKNQTDFNFIFDLYSGCSTTNRIGRFRLPANPDGYGVFDAHRALESYVYADIFPTLVEYEIANNSFDQFNIQIGEEFQYIWNFYDNFFSAGTVGFTGTTPHYKAVGDQILITQNPTGATNSAYDGVHTVIGIVDAYGLITDQEFGVATPEEGGTIIYSDYRKTIFTGLTGTTCLYITNAAISHDDFRNYDYQEFNIDLTSQGRFLTNVPNNYRFDLNSEAYVNAFATDPESISRLIIETDTGDEYNINLDNSVNNLCIPIGPYNLNNSSLSFGSQPVLTSANKRYSAYTKHSSSVISSEVLVFDLYQKCSPYTQYQLIFMDRLGSFVSFNFDLASTKSVNIERKEFKKLSGSYNPSKNSWSYDSYDRGRTIMGVGETKQYSVTSNWVTESESEYLKELFTSPEVYHIDSNGIWLPIIIKDSSYEIKQRVKDKIFNITLQFEYAQKDNIQRG